MNNDKEFTLYDNCIICNTRLPVKLIGEKPYCTIHYQIEIEKSLNKKRAKDGINWLKDFRNMNIEVNTD